MSRSMPPRKHPFGWTKAARTLLAVLAIVASVLMLPRPDRTNPTPLPGPPGLLVEPNEAPPAVLESLPRIGPVLAGRIVQARQQSPILSLADLQSRVRGIGPVTASAVRPYLRFDGEVPTGRSPAP